ncbi:hypothetical protein GTY20_39295 [Streptomyces sp. SID4946]|nr:hypothetical protein [Streptomyces sp. SID4946]
MVARNGIPVMRDCSSTDPAAVWTLHEDGTGGVQVVNKSAKACLVAGSGAIHHVSLGECSTAPSRQWFIRW